MGTCVSVRSTHRASLKTNLIGLLPIRGVDPLGWFFEQPLLNSFSIGDGSFLLTNSHEGKMEKMIGNLRLRRLTPGLSMFIFYVFYVFFFADLFCIVIF